MAKNGLKIIDSDIHVAEPADLWECHLEHGVQGPGPQARPSGLQRARAYCRHASFNDHGGNRQRAEQRLQRAAAASADTPASSLRPPSGGIKRMAAPR